MAYTTNYSLLEKLRNHDEISWQEFYLRYAPFIAGIARREHVDESAIDEIILSTMEEIFQKDAIAQYRRDLGQFRGFLSGIVKHRIAAYFRERKSAKSVENDDFDDNWENLFDQEYVSYLTQLMLDDLRNRVEETTFEAFYFTEIECRSVRETAAMLGISSVCVYQYRSRCLKHLKQIAHELQQNDPDFSYPFGK